MRRVGKGWGVVKRGVVYYFGDKVELFMGVGEKYVIEMERGGKKFGGGRERVFM